MTQEKYKTLKSLHESLSGLDYSLTVFGDHIAKREGYKDLSDLDALRFYLMQKHQWLPRDVMQMPTTELRFALTEELAGWTLPAEARL